MIEFNSDAADSLNAYFEHCRETAAEPLRVTNSANSNIGKALEVFEITDHCKTNGEPVAYSLPWLHKDVRQRLIALSGREAYSVNTEEEVDAQIPELTLQDNHPEVYEQLAEAFFGDIEPIIQALLGHELESIESIQLAVYEATGGVNKGTPHTDEDSDITVTVALNDDYEGGGLELHTGGYKSEVVTMPKLKAGTAAIFKGRMTVHNGLPVTQGQRNLLVFWCRV